MPKVKDVYDRIENYGVCSKIRITFQVKVKSDLSLRLLCGPGAINMKYGTNRSTFNDPVSRQLKTKGGHSQRTLRGVLPHVYSLYLSMLT